MIVSKLTAPWPYYADDELECVVSTLRSGQVNAWTGDQTRLFESEFSSFVGTSHSVALANGSLALSAAYLALGLAPSDQVITTPRTFIATCSSAALLGAQVMFADVDPDSGAITPESVEPLINSKTKLISLVHLGGWPADSVSMRKLADAYGIALVEDCSQAHGAAINGRSVGSFGHISTWSFCQDKIISTGGEGGMLSTSSQSLFESVWSFKDHGKDYQAVSTTSHPPGFRWLHTKFGSNFRLTEMQSAIGRSQLQKLPKWTQIRIKNAQILIDNLFELPSIRIPLPSQDLSHAWYKFYCFIKPEALLDGWSRDRIINEIVSEGFPAYSGSCSEVYLEQCFRDSVSFPAERLPVAKLLGETSLMFLVHPTITPELMQTYADTIKSVVKRATR